MSRVGRKSLPRGWGQGRAQSLGEQRKRGGGGQAGEKEGKGPQLPDTP